MSESTEERLLGGDTAYIAISDDSGGNNSNTVSNDDGYLSTEPSGMRQRKYTQGFDKTKGDITEEDAETFGAWGRDFQSANTPHRFLTAEKEKMSKFESNNYFQQNSQAYRKHLEKLDETGESQRTYDRWLAMGLIGLCVAFISFFVRQTTEVINEAKYNLIEPSIANGNWAIAWITSMAYSCGFVALSVSLVLFIAPAAASSGIPEVIAFLNGVNLPKIFNVRTLAVKFVSVICSVGSGLPVGPEGPMIHMGGMVGAGISQGRSSTMGFETGLFSRFRNVKDRRDFITCGVACGVSAAFGAPVGGLLFAMEEVASFWSQELGWQIFFGCMVAVFVSDLFNSSFEGYAYLGYFGSFNDENSILYKVTYDVTLNILALLPTVLCGVLGGVLGSIFTVLNLKVTRWRAKNVNISTKRRFIEPIIIMIIYGTVALFLPAAFTCTNVSNCSYVSSDGVVLEVPEEGEFFYRCGEKSLNGGYSHISNNVKTFTCSGITEIDDNVYDISYNDMATLITTTGEDTIHKLFSRGTSEQFSYGALVAMLFVYFIGACVTMGSSVAAGVVVPMLLIGGCYGRIVGKIAVDTLAGGVYAATSRWNWIDPGVFALIGAGSFFGGVSRLTLSLTVIMIEISNDIHMLLIMMATIMIAKWIADYTTHSLYHSLIELKCMPFLNFVIPSHTSMDRYFVNQIMTSPVVCVDEVAVVDDIRRLFDLTHQGFPVVADSANGKVIKGIILKETLFEILKANDLFFTPGSEPPNRQIAYSKIQDTEGSRRFAARHQNKEEKQNASYGGDYEGEDNNEDVAANADHYLQLQNDGLVVDLRPYMDESVVTVSERTSIERMYLIFRSLGLRHLPVVNEFNNPTGLITRKDIQGHDVAHAVEHHDHDDHDDHGHNNHGHHDSDSSGRMEQIKEYEGKLRNIHGVDA